MEIDIKCLECGKGTRNFQLGNLFYCLKRPTETAVIKEVIFCPKCKKDISNKKCLIKENDFLGKLLAISIISSIEKLPSHLKYTFCINEEDHKKIKENCKTSPNFVRKF